MSGSTTTRTWMRPQNHSSTVSGVTLVFGYGSLVDGPVRPAVLPGWRRTWGIAMDNAVDLPGYKHYEVPGTGERPAVMVAFLDVAPDPDPAAEVPGVVFEV